MASHIYILYTLFEKLKIQKITVVSARAYQIVYLLFEKSIPLNTQESVKVIIKWKEFFYEIQKYMRKVSVNWKNYSNGYTKTRENITKFEKKYAFEYPRTRENVTWMHTAYNQNP